MAKKTKRPKNPLLQQKFDEGYALGIKHGIQKATDFFIHKFEGLEDVEGIGPKTMRKIRGQLGHEYFLRSDDDGKQDKSKSLQTRES